MELDRKDLKIRALLEKVNSKEEEIADLRVELTILQAEKEREVKRLQTEVVALNERVAMTGDHRRQEEDEDFEVVEGEVVNEDEEPPPPPA